MNSIDNPQSGQQIAFREGSAQFAAFLKNTDQKAVAVRGIIDGLQTLAPSVWEKVSDSSSPFSTYYMGAGNFALEFPLTDELLKARGGKTKGFFIQFEEPSRDMRRELSIAMGKRALDGLAYQCGPRAFDDPEYRPPEADLAVSSHVWYYVGGWRETTGAKNSLVNFADIVRPKGGAGVIIVSSKTSDRYQLRAKFLEESGLAANDLAGEELVDVLDREGVATETVIHAARTDISSIVSPEGKFELRDEGEFLLSFILRSNWSEHEPELQEKISRLFEAIADKNGEQVMHYRDTYTWVLPTGS